MPGFFRAACLLAATSILPAVSALSNGTFTWPSTTSQCGTYQVEMYFGQPPWTMVIAPLNGQPHYWNITAPPRYDPVKSVTAQIPVQLAAGTAYTVYMLDSTGYFGGINPTEVQTVGFGSDGNCLVDVNTHVQDFTFTVAGSTSQCGNNFALSWIDNLGLPPYNFTVLPLDTSANPFDQPLNGGSTTTGETSWAVNMTAGTRFTIMMNNQFGYGRGGIGGIYQVAAGNSTSCIVSPMYATSAWPAGLQTTALLTAAALPTSVITVRASRSVTSTSAIAVNSGSSAASTTSRATDVPAQSSSAAATTGGGGLSTGAAAGIGAGIGVVALAAIAGLVWWFCIKRKKNTNNTSNNYARPVDLGDEPKAGPGGAAALGGNEPKVEPFPSPHGLGQVPTTAYSQQTSSFSSPVDGNSAHGHGYPYGMTAAAVGAGAAAGAYHRPSDAYSSDQLSPLGGTSDRYSIASGPNSQINPYFPGGASPGGTNTSNQAGPLPSKADLARQSYQPSPATGYSGVTPISPGSGPGSGSVSGSSSSGMRNLPLVPGMAMSDAGSDAKSNNQHQPIQTPSNQGHFGPGQTEPEFRVHRDSEAVVDLPPMYHDVPQRASQAQPQLPSGATENSTAGSPTSPS